MADERKISQLERRINSERLMGVWEIAQAAGVTGLAAYGSKFVCDITYDNLPKYLASAALIGLAATLPVVEIAGDYIQYMITRRNRIQNHFRNAGQAQREINELLRQG